jgi:hypothetical protein
MTRRCGFGTARPAPIRSRLALTLLAAGPLSVGLLSGACGRTAPPAPALDVTWSLAPTPSVVGPSTLTVTVRDPAGAPVAGATVRLEADMSHAGMAPMFADATERGPGVYEMPFSFTMRGDWVLLVSVALPDGSRLQRRIDVSNVRPSG